MLFFESKTIKNYNFVAGDKIKIKYYDEFKYLHFFQGVCIKKRRLKNGNFFIVSSIQHFPYISIKI